MFLQGVPSSPRTCPVRALLFSASIARVWYFPDAQISRILRCFSRLPPPDRAVRWPPPGRSAVATLGFQPPDLYLPAWCRRLAGFRSHPLQSLLPPTLRKDLPPEVGRVSFPGLVPCVPPHIGWMSDNRDSAILAQIKASGTIPGLVPPPLDERRGSDIAISRREVLDVALAEPTPHERLEEVVAHEDVRSGT